MTERSDLPNEYRIFGPPGTGKTTYLSKQVYRIARDVGSDAIMVASFTRTAAAELSGRNMPLDRNRIGTLHSFAFRQLDRPSIAEDPKNLADWNRHSPHLALSGAKVDVDHGAVDQHFETQGDDLLAQTNRLRGLLVPRDEWPTPVAAFAKRWEDFKREANLADFTDLIAFCIDDGGPNVLQPRVGFFDEVQDFTPLELALVRSWGQHMDRYLLAGDDDQAIYGFKGATPDAFLRPDLPPARKQVLAQSYRVPRAVHALASKWVARLSYREEKAYAPRDDDGEVTTLTGATWRNPRPLVDLMERQLEDDDGGDVMFLATCSYMVDPIRKELRDRGLPFWNPYRASRGDWNPIQIREDVTTALDRLMAYLRPDPEAWGDEARPWTWHEVHLWASQLRASEVFVRGVKTRLRGLAEDVGAKEADLLRLMDMFKEPLDFNAAYDSDLDWLEAHLLGKAAGPMSFPMKVVRKHGAGALRERPRIVIGTIHSVKGAQADHVILAPDLSGAAMRDWLGPPDKRDTIVRQMYVGVTRAKQKLTIIDAASRDAVDFRRYL